MTKETAISKKPLWQIIEEKILEHDPVALSGEKLEASIQRMASELDSAGFEFSRYGGPMIQLRFAVDQARKVGQPFLKDFNAAVSALTLDDVADPYAATTRLIDQLGATWPELRSAERRPAVIEIVKNTRLDLLIAKAKALPDDRGIRLLIEEAVDFGLITKSLEISTEKLNQVNDQILKERAERARAAALLDKAAGKTQEEKVRYLFDNSVSEELIMETAGVERGVIDAVKKSMEEELKEKQRLAAEEAARKKAEAEGPALDDIGPEDMLAYIGSIREIMEFSDQEKEIRTMCEQSAIPKALVDIAVSEPARLDELEKKAGG